MSSRRSLGLLCWACVLASSLLLFCGTGTHAAPQGAGYHVIRKIAVGGDGGWDYLTVDPNARRVYLSHATHVMVMDEDSGKIVGDIPDTKGIHGIAIVPELGRGFTSNGGEATVSIFDLKTLQLISKVKTGGENPDAISYDPGTKHILVFNHKSGTLAAIDPTAGTVVGTMATGDSPEAVALDGKGSAFLTLEDKNTLIEFDPKTLSIKNSWPTAPCEGPGPISMDTVHRRLFINCQPNKMMALVNADDGKVITTMPIGGGVDGGGFDPATGLAFASCGEGVLNVFHEDSPDKLSTVATVKTQTGARTMALDPKTHHVFVLTADFTPAAAPTTENPRPRPQIVPNSFVVIELGQ